eukprot:TRINITY_DN38886_c0_g1_i1.p1 TRINITY_DN38886_c0_g1~~TRINITY_DN38886_c0_g1_i1.p1  ORF type:complete len:274 (-),score=43.00 TRINITY_DN38886_c0_g1_i1:313-1134(-)
MGRGGAQTTASLAVSAIETGDVAALKQLYEQDFDLDRLISRGRKYNIVHNAALLGQVEVLRFCASHGFDMNVRDDIGFNAVFFALGSDKNSMESLTILASAGVDFHSVDKFGDNAVFYAASTGNVEVMQFIHQQGVDLRHLNQKGDNAALCAAEHGHLEVLHFLHQHGLNAAHVNHDGVNAALAAARGCHLNVLRYLHDLGVPLTAVDKQGRGIIWYAQANQEEPSDVKQKRQDIFQFLKSHHIERPGNAQLDYRQKTRRCQVSLHSYFQLCT